MTLLSPANGAPAVGRDVLVGADSFVVNVGELMNHMTNGRFRHVVHRVPNPEPSEPSTAEGRASAPHESEPETFRARTLGQGLRFARQ